MMIMVVNWLTDEKHLALFPAVTIVKDPHHQEFLTEREREREREREIWTCAEPEFRIV